MQQLFTGLLHVA